MSKITDWSREQGKKRKKWQKEREEEKQQRKIVAADWESVGARNASSLVFFFRDVSNALAQFSARQTSDENVVFCVSDAHTSSFHSLRLALAIVNKSNIDDNDGILSSDTECFLIIPFSCSFFSWFGAKYSTIIESFIETRLRMYPIFDS